MSNYEVLKDGFEFCNIFDIECKLCGNCDDCKLLNDYQESCEYNEKMYMELDRWNEES